MIKHHFLMISRNIQKNKLFFFINIIGLSIGLACCILIFSWVQHELSYDTFHENADQIYRVITEVHTKNRIAPMVYSPNPVGPALKESYPEVVNCTKYQSFTGWWISYGEKRFGNDRLSVADPSFFEIFDFPFLKGNPKTALNDRNAVVITERMAKKYFGNEDPMGKLLQIALFKHKVTGVIKDIPRNSHIQFGALFPVINMEDLWYEDMESWGRSRFINYIQLQKGSTGKELHEKISGIVKKNIPESNITIHLQPLKKVHLYSDFYQDDTNISRGNINNIYIFSLIAFCMLGIACINLVNLSTVFAGRRTKEIGIKKVVGALRGQLMKQFFLESVVILLIALVIAMILALLFLPVFNNLVGSKISIFESGAARFFTGILAIVFLPAILSALYPAIFLSSQPATVLGGRISTNSLRGLTFQKVLVVIQFIFAITLIIGTTAIERQISFMKNKDLGYKKENLICIDGLALTYSQFEVLRNELIQHPNIINVCKALPPTFMLPGNTEYEWDGKDPTDSVMFHPVFVDYYYADTYGMEMADGRFFSKQFPGDTSNFVVNETAVKYMGLKNPVGKRLVYRGSRRERQDRRGTIIGVIKDYHHTSLHFPIPPLILTMDEWYIVTVRIKPTDLADTYKHLVRVVKQRQSTPGAINYQFVDRALNSSYISDQKVNTIIQYFTILAIFISSLGLLGLISFMAEQRTKEIGIRKVFGSSIVNIITLLLKDFIKWVIVALIIACPLAWYFISRWLQDFSYRISIQWWMFLFAGGTTLIIVLFTVSYQTIKAARTNPINSLRYE